MYVLYPKSKFIKSVFVTKMDLWYNTTVLYVKEGDGMKLWDCHLHTDLSFDSRCPMEFYVKSAAAAGDEYFISTEHLDLESHCLAGDDIIPDFSRQEEIIKRLNAKYPVKVLWGIEIGWRGDLQKRNKEIAGKYPFDMIILSIHENDYADVSFPDVYMRGRSVDRCYEEYLGLIIEAINSFPDFDTFGHIDYLLRYIGDTDLSRHTRKLTQIFNLLIRKGKALEINTKMFPDTASLRRAEEIIKLYTSLGGERFTLGSDAHDVSRHRNGFDLAARLLKKYGVKDLCVYINRTEHRIPL